MYYYVLCITRTRASQVPPSQLLSRPVARSVRVCFSLLLSLRPSVSVCLLLCLFVSAHEGIARLSVSQYLSRIGWRMCWSICLVLGLVLLLVGRVWCGSVCVSSVLGVVLVVLVLFLALSSGLVCIASVVSRVPGILVHCIPDSWSLSLCVL